MKRFAVMALLMIGVRAEATVRCSGTAMQSLTVASGQTFTLPVAAVPGVLDYQVDAAARWTINPHETWTLHGNVTHDSVRDTTGAPTISQTLYNTAADAPYASYYVVTATNLDNTFVPCAQDFLVSVTPDPVLSRDSLRAVIPAAGSLRGANNSTYRTRVTLYNPWTDSISGRIVFHPTGQSASANDSSMTYSIASKSSQTWEDIVAAASSSGLGSLDIVPDRVTSGVLPMPDIRAQIVSVASNGGTLGTDIPSIAMSSPQYGAVWTDVAPPSVLVDDQHGAKRLSIGIRTLSDAVDVHATDVAPDGSVRAEVTRSFAADFHEQRPLSDWFGTAQKNDRIEFFASHHSAPRLPGGAIVYLAETDNVTNDVSVVVPEQHDHALEQPIVQCAFGCGLLLR